MGDVKHARLHSWYDGSEIYKRSLGHCAYQGEDCNEKVGSCHYTSSSFSRHKGRHLLKLECKTNCMND